MAHMRRAPTPAPIAAVLFLSVATALHGQIVETPTTAEPVRLKILRSAHRVVVYRGGQYERDYPVAVGRPGWETPLGQFQVFQMTRNPSWEHPLTHEIFPAGSPGNELGGYWIGFSSDPAGVIGFHATPHPETVGKSSSHGCVRMFERDIRELFAEVSCGTVVSVVP